MKVVGGRASQVLASRVAAALDCELLPCEFRSFPDGELYTRIDATTLDGEPVAIVQSLTSDTDFVCLLQLIEACEGLNASKISVVIPYLGYARQDRRFRSGEPISVRALTRCIFADEVFVVNPHSPEALKYFENARSVEALDAAPLLGEHFRKTKSVELVVAPDDGAAALAATVAGHAGVGYDVLEKTRLSAEEVEIKPKTLDVAGRSVALVDDIISTGGTIVKATSLLKELGASEVHVACVHAVLVPGAATRMLNAGVKEVVATDTLETIFSKVSVAELIARRLADAATTTTTTTSK